MALVGGGGKGITESIRELISPSLLTDTYLSVLYMHVPPEIRDYGVQYREYLGNKGAEEKTQWRIY